MTGAVIGGLAQAILRQALAIRRRSVEKFPTGSKNSGMNRWSIAFFSLFGIGLVWAGFHFWLLLYSGEELADEQVFEVPQNLIHNQKTASQLRHDPAEYQPFTVDLSPEMNPIAIYFGYERQKASSGRSEFDVEIESSAGEVIESFPVQLSITRTSSSSGTGSRRGMSFSLVRVVTTEIDYADTYQIRVVPGDQQGVPLNLLCVRIRKNVSIPPLANAFAAVLTSIFGMAGGILSVAIGRLGRFNRSAATVGASNSAPPA